MHVSKFHRYLKVPPPWNTVTYFSKDGLENLLNTHTRRV